MPRIALAAAPAAAIALLLAGCAAQNAGTPPEPRASAVVSDAAGQAKARASFTESVDGVVMRLDASGMAPGQYGAHIHTMGKCDAPGFTTAGGHWNPTSREHGFENPNGSHTGDMPNLTIGADGTGSLTYTLRGARLASGGNPLLDADGASVMIHAGADDYRTDPAGASGARIVCGVVMPS